MVEDLIENGLSAHFLIGYVLIDILEESVHVLVIHLSERVVLNVVEVLHEYDCELHVVDFLHDLRRLVDQVHQLFPLIKVRYRCFSLKMYSSHICSMYFRAFWVSLLSCMSWLTRICWKFSFW